jgi:alkylhydroperoxidase family enzyme
LDRSNTLSLREMFGRAAAMFASARQAIGRLPAALATFGHDNPQGHEAASGSHASLHRTSLSWQQIATLSLVIGVQQGNGSTCAARARAGKDAGLSLEALAAIRAGRATGDVALDSLTRFATALLTSSGTLPAEEVDALRSAGYGDTQIVDVLLAIARITLTSLSKQHSPCSR